MEFIAAIIGASAAGLVALIGALFKRNQNKKDQYEHIEKLVELTQGLKNFDFDALRRGLDAVHKEVVDLSQATKSNDLMMLRHSILLIYFTYNKEKEIPEAQYESMLGLYDVYTSLGGNSFVSDKVNEIKSWKRI